jgi:hypothetical protein
VKAVLIGFVGGCAATVVVVLAHIIMWGLHADYDNDDPLDVHSD